MNFNDHSNLRGRHAPFSPSAYYWLQDTEEEALNRYCSSYASTVGTILHELAKEYIDCSYKMTRFDKKQIPMRLLIRGVPPVVVERLSIEAIFENLMNYINDAVEYRMKAEVPLYYSDNVFGTADTICFDERERMLRIHDLKNGVTPAKIDQLMIYNALFCLEYGHILKFRPEDITSELRIYQGGEIVYCNPKPDDVIMVMEQIKRIDDAMTRAEQEAVQ